jgi:hypothetical protein
LFQSRSSLACSTWHQPASRFTRSQLATVIRYKQVNQNKESSMILFPWVRVCLNIIAHNVKTTWQQVKDSADSIFSSSFNSNSKDFSCLFRFLFMSSCSICHFCRHCFYHKPSQALKHWEITSASIAHHKNLVTISFNLLARILSKDIRRQSDTGPSLHSTQNQEVCVNHWQIHKPAIQKPSKIQIFSNQGYKIRPETKKKAKEKIQISNAKN